MTAVCDLCGTVKKTTSLDRPWWSFARYHGPHMSNGATPADAPSFTGYCCPGCSTKLMDSKESFLQVVTLQQVTARLKS